MCHAERCIPALGSRNLFIWKHVRHSLGVQKKMILTSPLENVERIPSGVFDHGQLAFRFLKVTVLTNYLQSVEPFFGRVNLDHLCFR